MVMSWKVRSESFLNTSFVRSSQEDSSFRWPRRRITLHSLPRLDAWIGGIALVETLTEVADQTGLVVGRESVVAAADAIEQLVLDPGLRLRMGAEGRRHVERYYDLEANIDEMISLYWEVIARNEGRRESRR